MAACNFSLQTQLSLFFLKISNYGKGTSGRLRLDYLTSLCQFVTGIRTLFANTTFHASIKRNTFLSNTIIFANRA